MTQQSMHAASIPNPALQPFGILIGTWNTTGTHDLVPDTILHGRTSFEWLEHGAFLLMRSEIDDPRFPRGIAIIGSDDAEIASILALLLPRRLMYNPFSVRRISPGTVRRR